MSNPECTIGLIDESERITKILKEKFTILDRIIIADLIKSCAYCEQFDRLYKVKYDLKEK